VHKATSLAATAVVVLALTLTGCGNDGEKDKGPSGTSDKAASGQPGKADATTASPSADATRSASPGPSRTHKAEKRPGTSTTRPDRPAATTPSAPRTTRTTPPAPSRPASPSSVQGTWYYAVQGKNGAPLLTVSGTSWTLSYNGNSCSGTIAADLAISSTCQGESASGQAVVSNNGQNLAFNWTTGTPDRFVRTKPAG